MVNILLNAIDTFLQHILPYIPQQLPLHLLLTPPTHLPPKLEQQLLNLRRLRLPPTPLPLLLTTVLLPQIPLLATQVFLRTHRDFEQILTPLA